MIIAIPRSITAQLAEVTGCRGALGVLTRAHIPVSAARVAGDNLGTIRYGAGSSRFRQLSLYSQMEQALSHAQQHGWLLSWQAVRRRFNEAADELATAGIAWAHELYRQGHSALQHFTVWHERPDRPRRPDHFPPATYLHLTHGPPHTPPRY